MLLTQYCSHLLLSDRPLLDALDEASANVRDQVKGVKESKCLQYHFLQHVKACVDAARVEYELGASGDEVRRYKKTSLNFTIFRLTSSA